VVNGDLGAGGHSLAQVGDEQVVAGRDLVVVGVVGEVQRQDSEVGQVLPVDTGVGLGDHQAQPEVSGDDRGVLPRGALPVVGAGDDDVLPGLPGPDGVAGVELGEGEVGQFGDVAPVRQDPGAG